MNIVTQYCTSNKKKKPMVRKKIHLVYKNFTGTLTWLKQVKVLVTNYWYLRTVILQGKYQSETKSNIFFSIIENRKKRAREVKN